MTPTVSVVIPAYNVQDGYLRHAVDSVLAQTRQVLEILIIDDGSEKPIENVFSSEVVKVIRQENCGQAKARNFGVSLAGGDFVAFLDADDTWDPHKIELQCRVLEASPEIDVVGCRSVLTDHNGNIIGLGPGPFSGDLRTLSRQIFLRQAPYAILIPSMVLIPRKIFLDSHGFDSKFQPIEDLVFFDRLFAQGVSLGILESPLLRRRIHGESLTLQYRSMLKSYRKWADSYVCEESGESEAQLLRETACEVSGLSALAGGYRKAARHLLKASLHGNKTLTRCLGFILACMSPYWVSQLRRLKRMYSKQKSEEVVRGFYNRLFGKGVGDHGIK